tara:strand:+ start:1231 stop:2124 length:894 start_codon:yes stop_codon:yes gene_type:complete
MVIDSVNTIPLLVRLLLRSRRTTAAKVALEAQITEKTAQKIVSWKETPVNEKTICKFFGVLGLDPARFIKSGSSFFEKDTAGSITINFYSKEKAIKRKIPFSLYEDYPSNIDNSELFFEIDASGASKDAVSLISKIGLLLKETYGKKQKSDSYSLESAQARFENKSSISAALSELDKKHKINLYSGYWLTWKMTESKDYSDVAQRKGLYVFFESVTNLGFIFSSRKNIKNVFAFVTSSIEPPLHNYKECEWVYVNGVPLPTKEEADKIRKNLIEERKASDSGIASLLKENGEIMKDK